MLHALPFEIVTTICCFIRVNALARLRQTCKYFTGLDEWRGALFAPKGEWFELKDVGLAAKYMNWSQRVPSVRPSSLDTMKHLAVWGSICDQEGRLLATFSPVLAPLYVDPLSICFTEDDDDDGPTLVYATPEDIQWTWEDPVLYTEFTTDGRVYYGWSTRRVIANVELDFDNTFLGTRLLRMHRLLQHALALVCNGETLQALTA